ncbi:MAG: HAD-IC family P-type ATPase, partial [Proteobacteria bacterium]|nr:HAD-IC family P-type ATPase [Pseudomonadota bacterium]
MSNWHAEHLKEVSANLNVDPQCGLEEAEAARRLDTYGPNRPSVQAGQSAASRFLAQLTQPMILVLIAAGGVTLFLREWVDASVIFGVVLVNALVGFIQEGKAEAALAALARAVAAEATVMRSGRRRRLDAGELVPGDVVVLAAGDKVPADLRLFAGKELRTAEAALTGESVPVDKHTEPLDADTALADRRNMAYTGTLVVAGQGTGVVVATGDTTETGRISGLIARAPDLTTPLTRKLGEFTRYLLVAIMVLAALTFAVGVWRGESVFDMFMAAVALAVGAIPEGLPAAMTVTLAIGVARMAKRRAIIRKLPAVETLGGTTVICSDKTGTLTENAMTVREIWAGDEVFAVSGNGYAPAGRIELAGQPAAIAGALRETLLASVLCNDARLVRQDEQWTVAGDPTEGALLVAARKAQLDEATLNSIFPRLDELPFDSVRLCMATLHEIEGSRVVYVKGAVEKLLSACAGRLDRQGREASLDAAAVHAAVLRMAAGGLRVLAVARSGLVQGQQLDHARLGSGLVFLGLIGMIDPPRPRAIAAVRTCHAAGIRVKMITGDHPGTALAIAGQLGIVGDGATALTGRDLALLDDAALRKAAIQVDVFARVEPEQKLRLVQALQANGEVVAMTGDGVNDAPALKQADIGIAMGQGGTEVAKEAAAMVLTDDNFATIEAAIEEGRGIYDNL